jgi:hypothetical protein
MFDVRGIESVKAVPDEREQLVEVCKRVNVLRVMRRRSHHRLITSFLRRTSGEQLLVSGN